MQRSTTWSEIIYVAKVLGIINIPKGVTRQKQIKARRIARTKLRRQLMARVQAGKTKALPRNRFRPSIG